MRANREGLKIVELDPAVANFYSVDFQSVYRRFILPMVKASV